MAKGVIIVSPPRCEQVQGNDQECGAERETNWLKAKCGRR